MGVVEKRKKEYMKRDEWRFSHLWLGNCVYGGVFPAHPGGFPVASGGIEGGFMDSYAGNFGNCSAGIFLLVGVKNQEIGGERR